MSGFIDLFSGVSFESVFRVVYYSVFFWAPAFLIVIFLDIWKQYKNILWFSKVNYVLLEIKLPKDVFKSPKAMEFFINGLYKGDNEDTWWHVNIRGQTRPQFSLEIVAIDGKVRFFVRTRKWLQAPIESNLYSQFPGIEVYPAEDYTLGVKYDPEKQNLWGTEFTLDKPDVFPIKTYVDFGMDKDPKEEFKIDPLTPFIEYIGSWGKGHQMWLQIIVRNHKNENPDPEDPKKDLRWNKAAADAVDKIIQASRGEKGPDGKLIPGTSRLTTESEKQIIEAIARKQIKNSYDVGMRFIYTAPKDIFVVQNLTGAVGGIMNFGHADNLNRLKGINPTGTGYSSALYDFPVFKNRKKKKVDEQKVEMLDTYKRRAYFYKPYRRKHFILNSEELATLFHFPGQVSTTPTLEKIEAKKAEAPANLPI